MTRLRALGTGRFGVAGVSSIYFGALALWVGGLATI